MTNIKGLKKIKNGLIIHQTLSKNSKLQEPLYIDANYVYTDTSLNLQRGIIYFYIEDYKKLVFEINDSFKPKNFYDVGGISIIQGERIYNLYQYNDDIENIKYNYSRVTKIINTYYGEGSENGKDWFNKGDRFLSNGELIGITYESSDNFFELNEIKIYIDPSWYIYGLKEGNKLEIYSEDESKLLYELIIDRSEIAKITNVMYPINCKIKCLDNNNDQILDFVLTDIWGGDEYYTSINIELYNSDKVLLYLEDAKHLGTIKYGQMLKELIYIVNSGNTNALATIRVSPDSPAYDWVELEYLNNRSKEIMIPLSGLGEDEFHIVIIKPDDEELSSDYKEGQEYLFYLEVI